MPNESVSSAEAAPLPGYGDRCTIRGRSNTLSIMADAAIDVSRHTNGDPKVSPLLKLRGSSVLMDFPDKVGLGTLARALLLHGARTGQTPGQALDELFDVLVLEDA